MHHELTSETPTPPSSEAPSMQTLSQRLRLRDVRRRRRRWTMTLGMIACGILIPAWMSANDRPEPTTIADGTEPETSSDISASTVVISNDELLENEDTSSDSEAVAAIESPSMRVFATVSKPVAIYGLDETSQVVRHVGWIESRATVSIELDQLQESYRELLKAKLSVQKPNPSTKFISL